MLREDVTGHRKQITIKEFRYKSRAYIHRKLVIGSKGKPWYLWLYRSYWHTRLFGANREGEYRQYIAARPNPGAGIGHQIANWLSGYKISQYYKKDYATFPFSNLEAPFEPNEWEEFLGLNAGEIDARSLLLCGYKMVLMPAIDFESSEERKILSGIIRSYAGKKIIFLLEMDQFAGNELAYLDFMRKKYDNSPERKYDKLLYKKGCFHVAVHIRRGDIVPKGKKVNENLAMRWLDIEYYKKILDQYLPVYALNKKIEIFLFSQAGKEELCGFERFGKVHFCNEMNAKETFLHMVNADMLIMSRSGMSYQAAKLNKCGVIIYPYGFWREPVDDERWIIAAPANKNLEDEDGIRYTMD